MQVLFAKTETPPLFAFTSPLGFMSDAPLEFTLTLFLILSNLVENNQVDI
jgi:hypothetical protein